MGSINQNSFDAWGRSRNPENWQYDMSYKENMPLPELTTRGYTGHEHLNQFQLINMNGRLYDPITKQMSQPDIHNPDPYSTQSYNRYSYCMNNPLKYNDPSGYTSEGAAYSVWSMNEESRRMQDFWNEIYIGQIWSYQMSEMAYYAAVKQEHRFELIGDMQAETVKAQKILEAFAKANGKIKTNAEKIADGGEDEKPKGAGFVLSASNGMAAFGPVGGMFDIGSVTDSYGNSKMYLTFGWAMGYGATAGMGFSKLEKNSNISDFSGWSSGTSLSLPIKDKGLVSKIASSFGTELYGNFESGAMSSYIGNDLFGGGFNVGVGKGWFIYQSYTITFAPPSRQLWLHPAMHL